MEIQSSWNIWMRSIYSKWSVQTHIHTWVCNVVTLVLGLLRLAPITYKSRAMTQLACCLLTITLLTIHRAMQSPATSEPSDKCWLMLMRVAGLGKRVVFQLCRPLQGGNYQVFAKTFFPLLHFWNDLLQQNIYACGATCIDRHGFPEALKKVVIAERGWREPWPSHIQGSVGECHWTGTSTALWAKQPPWQMNGLWLVICKTDPRLHNLHVLDLTSPL